MSINLRNCFNNEKTAGIQLAKVIPEEIFSEDAVMVSINDYKNGVIDGICEYIDKTFNNYTFIAKPIYSPKNSECIIAVISETKELIKNDSLIEYFEISSDYIYKKHTTLYQEILNEKIENNNMDIDNKLKNREAILVCNNFDDIIIIDSVINGLVHKKVSKIYLITPIMPKNNISSQIKGNINKTFSIYEVEDYISRTFYYKS